MSFDEFLLESKKSPGHLTLKNEGAALKSLLLGDIKVPEFYDHISDVERISLFLGSHFMDKPQYIKNEQMMCVVNGAASVVLVAHVHKQEAYAAQMEKFKSQYYDPALTSEEQVNVSPANFFLPNF